jgi:hypothetical protein
LGEADILAGQVLCPRSPPDFLATFSGNRISKEDWVVSGVCAYVPQVFVCLDDMLFALSFIIAFRLRGFGMNQSRVITFFSSRDMKNLL